MGRFDDCAMLPEGAAVSQGQKNAKTVSHVKMGSSCSEADEERGVCDQARGKKENPTEKSN